jgi:hypothetical protein
MRELRSLSASECVRLLAGEQFGRIVFTEAALPAVRPVRYTLRAGAVVLQTCGASPVSKLDGCVVAFEVGHIDADCGKAWSVVVVGKAQVVTDADVVGWHDVGRYDVGRHDPACASWVPGDHQVFLRIPLDNVSGRCLATVMSWA